MILTPEEIIEYNREMVLDNSAMFRGGCIGDLRKHPRTIFLAIYWFFATHYRDIKTRRFYDSIPTDPAHWVIFGDNPDNNDQVQKKYMEWIETNGIKYKTLWFHYFTQYSFVFENKEDTVKFNTRWEWIDRGLYTVEVSTGDKEMFTWLNDNCDGDHRFYSGGMVSFEKELDAVAFKLRWL